MNHLERTVAMLAEVNPPAAAAVRAVGSNGSGHALPGLLGWLHEPDRLDVARACWFAIAPEGPEVYYDRSPEEMAAWMRRGNWLHPRSAEEEARIDEAVIAWARAADRTPLHELLIVRQRRRGS